MNNSDIRAGLILLIWGSSLFFASFSQGGVCDLDDFPQPDDMETYSILGGVVHNNRVIKANGYTSNLSMSEIEAFYTDYWDERVLARQQGPWRELSTMQTGCFLTVQMADSPDGSEGRLVIFMAPTGPLGEVGAGLALPSETYVITDTVMDDGPKQGRVSVLSSGSSAEDIRSFYYAEYSARGYSMERDFEEMGHLILIFRKGLNVTNIAVSPTTDSRINHILINSEEIQ